MLKRSTAHNPKLIKASNAIFVAYQAFSKDLKKFGFVKKVEQNKKAFQLPQRVNWKTAKNFYEIDYLKEIIPHGRLQIKQIRNYRWNVW